MSSKRALRNDRRAVDELLRAVRDTTVADRGENLLAPLVRYDAEHGGDLVRTLRTYLRANGNASRTADLLFLHRNGLLYRLGRIEELVGVSLNDAECRLALEIAMYVDST